MTIASRLSVWLLLWLLFVFGCGGSGTKIGGLSGSVKYKGNPVTAGTITFTAKGEGNDSGGTYLASIDPNGTYSAPQLPVGEFEVAIETESANPKRPSPENYGQGKAQASPRPEGVGAGPGAKGAYVKIPAKYADPKKSGLTVTVTSGKNTKDFELTD